jgi:hypothetical protein
MFEVLQWLEERMLKEEIFLLRRGFLKGRVSVETREREVLCEIRPGPVFRPFGHQTSCRIRNVELKISTQGIFNRTLVLGEDEAPLFVLEKRSGSKDWRFKNWAGTLGSFQRKGIFRQRYLIHTCDSGKGVLAHFKYAPIGFKTSVNIYTDQALETGTMAALTMLVYYQWYIVSRLIVIGTTSAGGS